MKLSVRHRTHYAYSAQASHSINHVCLLPRDTAEQTCLSSELVVTPRPNHIEKRIDQFGNRVASFGLHRSHTEIDIVVDSLIETTDTRHALPASQQVDTNSSALRSHFDADSLMARDCLLTSPSIELDASVASIIGELPLGQEPVLDYANRLMQHIYETFQYESGFSTVITPLSTVVEARKGVCQDFAHLAIAVLRKQGVPARYVSGYLETVPPPGVEKLQGADASHAWFAVYAANLGWFDFDPTNNKRPDSQYVTVGWGRDYSDVVPVKGVVYGGGANTLTVEVDVNRIQHPKLVSE
ncbi:MAG: transglutaminase family protein [Pseudomonadota bacterium]